MTKENSLAWKDSKMCVYVVVVGKRYRVSLEEAEIEQFGLTDHEIT